MTIETSLGKIALEEAGAARSQLQPGLAPAKLDVTDRRSMEETAFFSPFFLSLPAIQFHYSALVYLLKCSIIPLALGLRICSNRNAESGAKFLSNPAHGS